MSNRYAVKLVSDALDACHGYRQGEMLRWMLSMAFHIMGLPEWETIPDEVKPQVKQALIAYENAVARSHPFSDILGEVYMELVSRWGKSALGQFFTPQPIAQMMAQMTIGGKPLPEGRLIYACDHAVGSGVMMLSLLQSVLSESGPDGLKCWSVTGIDLDPVCARMFALQVVANCSIHQVQVGEVLAYHGDALDKADKLKVILHATPPQVVDVVPALHPARVKAVNEAAQRGSSQQLNLFELLN